jgi:hypothetical protein
LPILNKFTYYFSEIYVMGNFEALSLHIRRF